MECFIVNEITINCDYFVHEAKQPRAFLFNERNASISIAIKYMMRLLS
jgi:hypothetical protein